MDTLESQLKTKLLTRTTRKLHLTEEGEKFYPEAKSILEQYEYAIGEVRSLKANPTGTIRLATSMMFGRRYITPLLKLFLERYPNVSIDHFLSDSMVDLIQEGIDLSIRIGELGDSSHQARRIGISRRVTVATPGFLKNYHTPEHPMELKTLPCVIYTGLQNPYTWRYVDKSGKEIFVPVSGAYKANSSEAVLEAVLAGMGVYPAPLWLIGDALQTGRLLQILTDFEPGVVPIYALKPASIYVPHKVDLLINFLIDELKLNPWIS
jgi:DNA-binding transcriptional LysR family regulator